MDEFDFTGTWEGLTARDKRRFMRVLHAALASNDLCMLKKIFSFDLDPNFVYNRKTPLQVAVESSNVFACEKLLKLGANVHEPSGDERESVIIIACRIGSLELVKLLLDYDADCIGADLSGATPISTCALYGKPELVDLLVSNGAFLDQRNSYGQTPLLQAVTSGHTEVVKKLAERGADVDAADNEKRTGLIHSAVNDNLDMANVLISLECDLNACDKQKRTAVFEAAYNGYLEILKSLCHSGADPCLCSYRKESPLHAAIHQSQYECALFLIDQSAGIDLQTSYEFEAPIHAAIAKASIGEKRQAIKLVQQLIQKGCDVNAVNKHNESPLYLATRASLIDIANLLFTNGADINTVTSTGDTILHGSVISGNFEIVQRVLDTGCDVNSVNRNNESALYCSVAFFSDIRIVNQLIAMGADLNIVEHTNYCTAFDLAVERDHFEAAEALMNTPSCDINHISGRGYTPLAKASEAGRVKFITALLRHPSLKINKWSPRLALNGAIKNGYHASVDLLLNAGINPDLCDEDAKSALYIAFSINEAPFIRKLLRYGACPNISENLIKGGRCCRLFEDKHPHYELQLIFPCLSFENIEMFILLLKTYHHLPYNFLYALKEILLYAGPNSSMFSSAQKYNEFRMVLKMVLHRPRRLLELCRGAVRCSLKTHPAEKIESMELPERIKQFLLMTEVLADPPPPPKSDDDSE